MLSSFRSALTLAVALATNAWGQAGTNAMNNPYRMVENWGQLAAGRSVGLGDRDHSGRRGGRLGASPLRASDHEA